MKKLIKLTTFLGISTFLFSHSVLSHRLCTYTLIKDVYAADCSYRGHVEIPPDLNPEVEILILSHNNVKEIKNDSFSNYGNLQQLFLNDNTIRNNSIHRDAFASLSKLKILDLGLVRHNTAFNLRWPTSLKKLTISRNQNQNNINVMSLSELEVFNAVNCSLTSFPQFNDSAPIKEVDVSKNPLNGFSIQDLAPLCQLGFLGLQWTEKSTMNGSNKWCDCLKIQTWINHHRITCANLNCTKPDKSEEPCNVSFNEEMKKFELCLEKSIKTGQIIRVLLIALIPIVIIFTIWYMYT